MVTPLQMNEIPSHIVDHCESQQKQVKDDQDKRNMINLHLTSFEFLKGKSGAGNLMSRVGQMDQPIEQFLSDLSSSHCVQMS